MTFPVVRFVDAPVRDAGVRFDFNAVGSWSDDATWPEHEGFSLGVPEFEGDPDGIGVEYGLRDLSFNLIVSGSKAQAARTISRLSRELLRQSNWLLFQLDADSEPVWFKTYRSQPGDMSMEWVTTDGAHRDMWGIAVSLAADAFAYGERVTLPTVTISNDPTAASNALACMLPEIVGDAPAPLRVRAQVGPASLRQSSTAMLSVVAGADSAASFPLAGTVTGALGADTTYVNGAYTISFATTPGMASRFVSTWSDLPHGRYRVLVRGRVSDTSTEVRVRAATTGSGTSLGTIRGGTTTWQWITLTDIDHPIGVATYPGDFVTPTSGASIGLHAERVAGAGSFEVTDMLLVPLAIAEHVGRMLLATYGQTAGNVDAVYIDGDSETVRFVSPSDIPVYTEVGHELRGSFPIVVPGESHVLHYFPTLDPPDGVADDPLTTVTLDMSYQPAFLYLAGA